MQLVSWSLSAITLQRKDSDSSSIDSLALCVGINAWSDGKPQVSKTSHDRTKSETEKGMNANSRGRKQ